MNHISTKRRVFELDLLRGIFIAIIVIDHLQFWPSPLSYITGEGHLWVSAAEGFFLISGLLVGYIRGYKGRHLPLKDVAKKLLQRALMLYLWGVGVSFAIVLFTLAVGIDIHPLLPKLPNSEQLASPLTLIWSIASSNYFSDWIYFLRLYAIMLAATPLFLWLLRKNKEWLIMLIMLTCYAISFVYPEGGLQWQMLFFGAALIGYRFERIAAWLRDRPRIKIAFGATIIAVTFITASLSYYLYFIAESGYELELGEMINPWFGTNPLSPARIALSFVWFGGMLMFVHFFQRPIMKWLGWLLIPLGERSLSGYILQALLLPLLVVTFQPTPNWLINTGFSLTTILLIWLLLRSRIVTKIIPR